MNDNIVSIRKTDRFFLCKGRIEPNGRVAEDERLGHAFIKPGSQWFRLKMWMFPREQFFVAAKAEDPTKYVILSLDEYQLPSSEMRKHWNEVGHGEICGTFIRLRFHLFNEDIFLCLFPEKEEPWSPNVAA